MVEISEIFSTSSQSNVLKDPMLHFSKNVFSLIFGSCPRKDSFGAILVKT